MIEGNVIRNELKELRYYYSRKEMFDETSESVGVTNLQALAKKYNAAICLAPGKLYELYVAMYHNNNTVESAAELLGYCTETISRWHKSLVKYFQKALAA